MTQSNKTYKDLISFVESKINEIQSGFNDYQNECFVAKPAEFFCLELNGEAGELANIEKKKWKGLPIDHSKFEDEAADVLIALMNYANARNINLGIAVKNKLDKIELKRLEFEKEGKGY